MLALAGFVGRLMSMTNPTNFEFRRKHLSVPHEPRLLVAAQELWDALPGSAKSDLDPPTTHTPLTDTERLYIAADDVMLSFFTSPKTARHKLEKHGVAFDDAIGHWVWGRGPGHEHGERIRSLRYRSIYRALIELATLPDGGRGRLEGCLTVAAMVIDDKVMVEVPDPEWYINARSDSSQFEAAVAGIDPDEGTLRIDVATPDAVSFYFGL